jgi:hypothetical protein
MPRLIALLLIAFTIGCDGQKPPTQTGGKAVEIKTTGGEATTSP